MRIAYVDDTKQQGKRVGMGKLVALGAAIFEEEHVQPFAEGFREIHERLGIPHDVELKWAYPQDRSWFRDTGNEHLRTPHREAVLDLALQHEVKAVVVVWDLGGGVATAGGEGPEDAVITFMFERISAQIENSAQRGIIVFDKPGGDHKAEENWLTNRADMVRVGTPYVKPNAIVTQVLTAPSHLHPHIQLADLIAGSTTAAVAGNPYGMALMPKIKPLLCEGAYGVAGTGLKLYPDSILNLHHWVHDASHFIRRGTGYALPREGWRYASDDGLAK